MKDFGLKTTKKLTKIYGANSDGLNKLLSSFQALTAKKITLDKFAKQLSFTTPAELDTLPIIRRHLKADQQLDFAEHCHRVPTRPRAVILRLATNEKAGFRVEVRIFDSRCSVHHVDYCIFSSLDHNDVTSLAIKVLD